MRIAIILMFILNIVVSLEPKYLLNSYYNPNRLVFRLNSNAFECSMLGVVVPFYGNSNKCLNETFKKMSNLTIGYMQNNLDMEQLYGVRIINGFCIISFRNIILNEKIISDGYAVVNKGFVNDSEFLDRLLYLQDIAINNKKGLWNNFYNEMQCLKDSY
ncbi:thermonuclease family protein [Helicobacter sp. MIT 14-3879]|uniref:thermonuclease family protein n=1 Tax=Helicobacter sp. MIT 14-3879 TaxID=2040649 RepID=UPI000E1E6AF8|nr:thermonuclease family protein [Helicobacter sp. MIT 14-3879]RDU62663.1 hypothetical protein CQA44_06660 [Helicobacter sp. MIT 14-3879]